MPDSLRLNRPHFVAVWPGMGQVALNAGVYLLSTLKMELIAELDEGEVFDVDLVEIKNGIIQPVRRPRSRFFLWRDPQKKQDLIVFIGEAQPPFGKYAFCNRIIRYAKDYGVAKVFTFAAMATQMHPQQKSKVFGVATCKAKMEELKRLELEILHDGHIGGLNGVLLGVAAEQGLEGYCLLGEMPHIFNQIPYPKASLGILEVFSTMEGLDLDLTELTAQVEAHDQEMGEVLNQLQKNIEEEQPGEESPESTETQEPDKISPKVRKRISELFKQAASDLSKSFELKQELDKAGLFKEYEDRFLDLFKKPD